MRESGVGAAVGVRSRVACPGASYAVARIPRGRKNISGLVHGFVHGLQSSSRSRGNEKRRLAVN
jgi:hypothetical protein